MKKFLSIAAAPIVLLALLGGQVRGSTLSPNPQGAVTTGGRETVSLGGVTLHLGMAAEQAERSLSAEFVVQRVSAESDPKPSQIRQSWMIWTKDREAVVGNVFLKDGVVSEVIKDWLPAESTREVAVAKSLVGAVSELVRDGKRTCTIDRDERSGPTWESRVVLIQCGARFLKVEVSSHHDPAIGERTSVEEHLGGKAEATRYVR